MHMDFKIEGLFPALVTPKGDQPTYDEFLQLLQANRADIQQALLKHGALLFRGFPIKNADNFTKVVESLNFGNLVNYIGGDSPRSKVTSKVYTSTETPPSFRIPLHQELSNVKNFPRHIYFYCDIPPDVGGSTTIADARCVLKSLNSDVKQRFQEKGLTYISNYHDHSKFMEWINPSHKSWRDVFETDNKEDVEKKCKEKDFAWNWSQNDWLEIRQTSSAILQHPLTNETVWFNQAHLFDFNPKHIGRFNYIATKFLYFRKHMRLHEITFADGNQIPRKDFYHILDVLHDNSVDYPWEQGDVMILDNILAMHGRAPFSGKRRILTVMTA